MNNFLHYTFHVVTATVLAVGGLAVGTWARFPDFLVAACFIPTAIVLASYMRRPKAKAVLYLFVVVLISWILKTVVGIWDVVLPPLFLTIAGPILWRDGKVYSSKMN
jgi:hypothetical protein